MRGEDNLLAVEQTVLEEGTPDAIAMVVVYRIDDVIEDDHGAALREVLGKQNRQTQAFDVPFAEDDQRVVAHARLAGELHLDLAVLGQPQRVQQIAGRIGPVECVVEMAGLVSQPL